MQAAHSKDSLTAAGDCLPVAPYRARKLLPRA